MEDYTTDLLDKSTNELERIKLIEEIKAKRIGNAAQIPPEFDKEKHKVTTKIEYRKMWVTPLTTLILTFGSAVISFVVSSQLKNKELRTNNITEATKSILNYSVQYDTADNPKTKKFYTEIISKYPNYGDTSLKNLQSQFIYHTSENPDSIKKLGELVSVSAPPSDTLKLSSKARADLNKLDATAIQIQNLKINSSKNDSALKKAVQNLNLGKAEIKSLLPDSVNNAIVKVEDINKKVLDQINFFTPNTSSPSILKDYGTLWFKTGYFLQFDDMRVLLQYLDKQLGIQVQICKTVGTEICTSENSVVTKKWISYDNPLTLMVGESKYQISLQTIDHAGNNPFKLAAYINVLKLTQ